MMVVYHGPFWVPVPLAPVLQVERIGLLQANRTREERNKDRSTHMKFLSNNMQGSILNLITQKKRNIFRYW